MAKNLVIVESPGKVKSIRKFLGSNYVVEASVGHVRDLPKSSMGVDIENDFEPKYITIRGKGEVIAKLKKEAKNANNIYLATDPDREGEAISWHLAQLLNIENDAKCRITFNEITKNAVKNAIKSPRQIDMDLVDAQQARRVLDRIVGYKISPLLWRKVRKGLSAGRVQSVAVRLIIDREDEIISFVPEEYWTIEALLLSDKSKSGFKAKFYGDSNKKIELKNEAQVNEILSKIKNEQFIVGNVKKGDKRKTPAPPFTTSTLQQEASRKLGFTAKRTMMVAQQLYEGVDIKGQGSIGLVTYIRTDSTRISNDAQSEAAQYIRNTFGDNYLPEKPRIYKNRSASQDAHEAIRPTYTNMIPDSLKDSLTTDQYKLYKLIWERFVASQMASALYDTLTVDISAGEYIFKATGSKLIFPGFMKLYIEGRDEEIEEEEADIPELEVGQVLKLKKLDPRQHFTQPPQRYTEATLVKVLEEKGIGRPSTYAPIISTILARGYVEKEKKYLVPTELGRIVTDIMKNHFENIVDVEFTAQLEKQLDEVEEGQVEWRKIMRDFYPQFDTVLKEAENKIGQVEVPNEVSDIKCEKCGRFLVIKHGRYGKFLACPGFPECRNTKPYAEEIGVECPECGGKILLKRTRKGKKYYGCENNPECGFMTWDKPTNEKCPECGHYLVEKYAGRSLKLKCSNSGCGFQKDKPKA
jgi:DNA topoisomerase-1